MKNYKLLFIFLLLFSTKVCKAQVGVGTIWVDASAMLEQLSTTKGFLPPRLSTQQRDAIVNPAIGLQIYNTTNQSIEVYRPSGWYNLSKNQSFDAVHAENVLPEMSFNLSDTELQSVIDGFEQRRQLAFDLWKGKPRVLITSGSTFQRRHSHSYIDFAFRCYWNNEQNEAANQAVIDHFNLYNNDLNLMNSTDSYKWPLDEFFAMWEYFGPQGSIAPNRMSVQVQQIALASLWIYISNKSKLIDAQIAANEMWSEGSENHQLMNAYTYWHASKVFMSDASYSVQVYVNGGTPTQHYAAWTEFLKQWIRGRAKKGLLVEISNDFYNTISVKNLYNLFDFSPDTTLKQLSKNFLDVFWADWAQEILDNSIKGGGRTRISNTWGFNSLNSDLLSDMTYPLKMIHFYSGKGSYNDLSGHTLTQVTSSYRVPTLVVDMMLDSWGKGDYENIQRKPALRNTSPNNIINPDNSILRYSYVTPHYIMGSFFYPVLNFWNSWTHVSAQNRKVGVNFSSHPNAKIFISTQIVNAACYNDYWSAQKKGTMLVQKLPMTERPNGPLSIFISNAGLQHEVVSNDWCFFNYGTAYAALKAVSGSLVWDTTSPVSMGRWLTPSETFAVIAMEVAAATEVSSFEHFQTLVQNRPLLVTGSTVSYTGLSGDQLTFFGDFSALPWVNDQPISLSPPLVFNSPYIQSVWNSGIYKIKKGNRQLTIDFN